MSLEYRVTSLESDLRQCRSEVDRCQSELENIRSRARARTDLWMSVIVIGICVVLTVSLALLTKHS